jgi:hypothetical protein
MKSKEVEKEIGRRFFPETMIVLLASNDESQPQENFFSVLIEGGGLLVLEQQP